MEPFRAMESIEPLPWNRPHYTLTPMAGQSSPVTLASQTTCFDVVGGRGQGVQRLPGNEKYRALISMNKEIYARCHKHDKVKVSKGIVAAIREFGGRFLEYDERSEVYLDVGDRKAVEKTRQALRDGLSKKIYSKLSADHHHSRHHATMIGSPSIPLPEEEYFGNSVQLLESLHNAEHGNELRHPSPVSVATVLVKELPISREHVSV